MARTKFSELRKDVTDRPGARDRDRLDQYFTSVRELERRIARVARLNRESAKRLEEIS